jgi:hypothetical protein
MCGRNNACYDATVAELKAHGVTDFTREEGRHIKIKFSLHGRERTIVVSRSPSDRGAVVSAKAFARRFLRRHVKAEERRVS